VGHTIVINRLHAATAENYFGECAFPHVSHDPQNALPEDISTTADPVQKTTENSLFYHSLYNAMIYDMI